MNLHLQFQGFRVLKILSARLIFLATILETFNNCSPRIGATYDLSGDGKTIIRGNFAHYYDGYNSAYTTTINPTYRIQRGDH